MGKARALVSGAFGDGERTSVELPMGAALLEGSTAYVLIDGPPLASFGAVLVWADRNGVADLHVLVEQDAAVLARRAGCFSRTPTVWEIDGTALRSAEAAPVPVPVAAEPAPELAELLVDADLEVFAESGIVRGELAGLEVARIVHGTSTAGAPLDAPLLEVGVGHADREMTAMLHGSLSPVAQLARVVEIVGAHRRPDAEPHPLNQLAPERWLRSRLLAEPQRVGLARLRPLDPALPRPNLRDRAVAMAVGETEDGEVVVVACSVGIDLDLVPAAADARLAVASDARLLLVIPERDDHPVTRSLAARLRHPAEVVTIEGDWRR